MVGGIILVYDAVKVPTNHPRVLSVKKKLGQDLRHMLLPRPPGGRVSARVEVDVGKGEGSKIECNDAAALIKLDVL